MYKEKLSIDMPTVVKNAALDILNYFKLKKDKNLENYLEKINSCRYILVSEPLDDIEVYVNIVINIDDKDVEINKKISMELAGEYYPIIFNENGLIDKMDIIIINLEAYRSNSKYLEDKFVKITIIHEILHMLFSKIEDEKLKTGIGIIDLKKLPNNIYEYTDSKYLEINEAMTEDLSNKIYDEMNKEDENIIIDEIEEKIMYNESIYFPNSKIIKMINHTMYGNYNYQAYKENDYEIFKNDLKSYFKLELDMLEQTMFYIKSYSRNIMNSLSQEEVKSLYKELDKITIPICRIVFETAIIKTRTNSEKVFMISYLAECLNNNYLISSLLNIYEWIESAEKRR